MYANLRAEAAFVAQKRGYAGLAALDPDDRQLIEDLEADISITGERGLLALVKKEEIKKVIKRSPGRGDAWKMLQWGMEQGYRDETFHDQQDQLAPSGQESYHQHGLQQYAIGA